MSTKLNMLARKLGQASGEESAEPGESATNRMLISYKAEVDREAKSQIQAADDKRLKAEAEVSKLTTQLADLGMQLTQMQADMCCKMDAAEEASEKKMEDACGKHMAEMDQMKSKMESLSRQVATERENRIRAETQKEAADKMCAHLQQTVEKLQSAKPQVVQPAAPTPKPMTAKVTQRDENGRIVSMSITPSLQ